MIENIILPALGEMKVAEVTHEDIARLHASLKATPYRANRVLALLSKMMNLAVQPWKLRTDNPTKGVVRFPEERRDKWLTADELRRLCDALDAVPSSAPPTPSRSPMSPATSTSRSTPLLAGSKSAPRTAEPKASSQRTPNRRHNWARRPGVA